MLTVPLSVGLFAWAGVLYFTSGGNPTNITRAHGIFRSVIIGFVIALSAWLVVQTILHSLVKKNFFLTGTWNSLTCAPDGERPRESNITDMFSFLRGGISGGAVNVGGQTPLPTNGAALDVEGVTRVYGAQISNACQSVSVPNCNAAVAALIAAESSGNTGAVSSKGALGLMQLLPANGGKTCGSGDTACATDQIQKGVAYFGQVYAANQNNLRLTYAAYNGGQSAVQQSACCPSGYAYQCDWDCGTRTAHSLDCTASPRPAACVSNTGYQETRNYVNKLCAKVGC
jgi:hypothetical protein